MIRAQFFTFLILWPALSFAQTNSATVPAPQALKVLTPAGHFPAWLQKELEQKLNSPIFPVVYNKPEDALTLLKTPGAQFDLALISERIVPELLQANALRSLPTEHGTEPDHLYLGHYFDRDNRYVLPYAWALAVLAYDGHKVHTPPSHWSDLSEPSLAKEVFSSDPLLPDALARKEHHPLPSAPPQAVDPKGAVYRLGTFSSLRAELNSEPDWKYAQPAEGSLIYLFELALPASGTNNALADQAVPLVFDPATTARLDSENFLAVTQPQALPLVPAEVAHNPLIYAPHKIVDLSSFIKR